MALVLRKSHGAYSAGTRINVVDRDMHNKVNLVTPEFAADVKLHVHDDDLVELRSCTAIAPIAPRWLRRRNLTRSFNATEAIS